MFAIEELLMNVLHAILLDLPAEAYLTLFRW
jgi:hypothetical protein